MGQEATKACKRRKFDSVFADFYFVGDGIDLGCGDDCIIQHKDEFPKMLSCKAYDIEDGDAQYVANIADNTFDFVHSSHSLEHMKDPTVSILNWLRILKPGGHLIVTIPHKELYEHNFWPSRFNGGHITRWEIFNHNPEKDSISLIKLLTTIPNAHNIKIKKIQLIEHYYDYNLPDTHDQTGGPAECAIEFVVQKIK